MHRWLVALALAACSRDRAPAPKPRPAAELPPPPAPKQTPAPPPCHWVSYGGAGMGRSIDGVLVTGSHIDVDLDTGAIVSSLIVEGYDAPFHRIERTLDLAERTRLSVLVAFAIAEPHPDLPPIPDVSERLGMCAGAASASLGAGMIGWPASATVVHELHAIATLAPPRRMVTPRSQLPAALRDRLPRHGLIAGNRVVDFDRHTIRDGTSVKKMAETDDLQLWTTASLAWVDDPDPVRPVRSGDDIIVFADGNEVMLTTSHKPFTATLVRLLAR